MPTPIFAIFVDFALASQLTLRITRLRASKTNPILRQFGWQDKVENRSCSKSG
jgi:hypothetical protein